MTQKSLVVPAAIGGGLGAVLWILDSELRSFVYPTSSFLSELLHPAPDVFAVRVLAQVLMVVAAVMAAALVQLYAQRHHTNTLLGRIRALYGHTPDPIIGIDNELKVAFVNDAAAELVGVSGQQIEGRYCHEAIKQLGAPCEGCQAAEVFLSGKPESREVFERRPGGKEHWVAQSWRPFVNEEGEVELVIEVVRDITRLKCYEDEVKERKRAQEELLSQRDRTQHYLDATTAILVAVEPDGAITMVNERACTVLEMEAEEVLGHRWDELFVTEEQREEAIMRADEARHGIAESEWFECDLVSKSGRVRTIAWGVTTLGGDGRGNGRHTGVLCSGVDVTEQREAERELEFRSFLLDESSDEIIVHTLEGMPIYVNASFCARRGLSRNQVLSLSNFGWVPEQNRQRVDGLMSRIRQDGNVVFESFAISAKADIIPLEIHACLIDVRGEQLVVSSGRDITERKEAEATIQRMAFYDELTGLANRALFLDRLRIALANSTRSGHPVAVMFLDLDYFKHINDTLGHTVGDALLQAVAARLMVNVREGDTLARLGGDEFTLVIPECSSSEDAEAIAEKILSAFEEPFDIGGGRELSVTASIGLTLGTGATLAVEEALGQADAAMYRAKEDGRNRVRSYSQQLGLAASERFSLRERLRLALHREEFELLYQPQIDAATGKMICAEALIRWRHPERGLLAPSQFLHVAEEAGLMPGLGAWTLGQVTQTMREWDEQGLTGIRVAVNISPRELLDPKFLPLLSEVVSQPDFDAARLEIEVTETYALSDPQAVAEILSRVRLMGICVAMDDFGTGFSSLDHLRRMPIDAVKIDRTFVQEIGVNPEATVIARTVVSLAHSLGMRVIAEGVETTIQRDFLREHECDAMQGFLFCEPLSARQVAEVFARGIDLAS